MGIGGGRGGTTVELLWQFSERSIISQGVRGKKAYMAVLIEINSCEENGQEWENKYGVWLPLPKKR